MRVYRNPEISMGMIKSDLICSENAYTSFLQTGNKSLKGICAYHIQQAVEKSIKLQIYSLCSNINNSKLFTHDLLKLNTYALQLNINLYIPFSSDELRRITVWESSGRYDLRFSVRLDTLQKYIAKVNNLYITLYNMGFR